MREGAVKGGVRSHFSLGSAVMPLALWPPLRLHDTALAAATQRDAPPSRTQPLAGPLLRLGASPSSTTALIRC